MMMLNAQNLRRPLIRRIVAVAVLGLFVLRGLAFIGMAVAMAATDVDNPVFVHTVLGDHCARQDGSDEPRKGTHPELCVLCSSLARDVVALSVPIFAEVFLLTLREPSGSAPRFEEIPHLAKPPGLIANWSATSPPLTRGL